MGTNFLSTSRGKLTYEQMIESIAGYIREDTNYTYQLIVGTDSEARGKDSDFVSAVIVHRLGKGGIYFWQKENLKNVYAMHDRIAKETLFSIELAWKLRDTFRHNGLSGIEPEVHLDVGENGLTRDMVKWVSGMVLGSGFKYKIKPDSYGASKVADRYT